MDVLKAGVWVVFTSAILFLALGCGASEEKKKSISDASNSSSMNDTAKKTPIIFEPGNIAELKKGDQFTISSTDTSIAFNLEVRRLQETVPGIISISAFVEEMKTGQAVLILRDEKISGQIDLFKQNIKYLVAYDSADGTHYIQEVNSDSLDEIEGSQPLVPDLKNLKN